MLFVCCILIFKYPLSLRLLPWGVLQGFLYFQHPYCQRPFPGPLNQSLKFAFSYILLRKCTLRTVKDLCLKGHRTSEDYNSAHDFFNNVALARSWKSFGHSLKPLVRQCWQNFWVLYKLGPTLISYYHDWYTLCKENTAKTWVLSWEAVAQLHITFLLRIFLILLLAVAVCVCTCMCLTSVIFQKFSPILLVCFSEHLFKPLKGSPVLY